MILNPERYLGVFFVALLGSAMAMPALDWWDVAHLPSATLEAVERELPGGTASWVESNDSDGATVYDVHVRHEGAPCVVQATPQGQVLQVTRTLGLSDLPGEVREQLRSQFPNCSVRTAMMITDVLGRDRYEVAVVTGKQLTTVTLDKAEVQTGSDASLNVSQSAG